MHTNYRVSYYKAIALTLLLSCMANPLQAEIIVSHTEIKEICMGQEAYVALDCKVAGNIIQTLQKIQAITPEEYCSPEFCALCKRLDAGYTTAPLAMLEKALECAYEILEKNHRSISNDCDVAHMLACLNNCYAKVMQGALTIKHNNNEERAPRPNPVLPQDDSIDPQALLNLPRDLNIERDGQFGGNLQVHGNTTIDGDLGVGGNTNLAGDLTVGGDVVIDGGLTVIGPVIIPAPVFVGDVVIQATAGNNGVCVIFEEDDGDEKARLCSTNIENDKGLYISVDAGVTQNFRVTNEGGVIVEPSAASAALTVNGFPGSAAVVVNPGSPGIIIGDSGADAEIDMTGATPLINADNSLTISTTNANSDITLSPNGQVTINGAAGQGIALLITPTGNQTALQIGNAGTSAEINMTGASPVINAANDLDITIGGVTILEVNSANPHVVVNGNLNVTGTITSGGTITPSGQILAINGTAGAPSYSFASDTDTGIYRSAANEVTVSAGAANRLSINGNAASSILTIAGGAGGTQILNIIGNTDLAHEYRITAGAQIHRIVNTAPVATVNDLAVASANSLRLSAGGAERVVISGIGTITVNAPTGAGVALTVRGFAAQNVIQTDTGTQAAPAYSFVGDSNTGFYLALGDVPVITAGGANRLSIDGTSASNTNVNIIGNVDAKLTLLANVDNVPPSTGSALIDFHNGNPGTTHALLSHNAANFIFNNITGALNFQRNGTNAMQIQSNGIVNIASSAGTFLTPGANDRLTVNGNISYNSTALPLNPVGSTNLTTNFRVAMASVVAAGLYSTQEGFDTGVGIGHVPGSGSYTLTFATPFTTAPYAVATLTDAAGAIQVVISNILITILTYNSAGVLTDGDFQLIVIGA